MRKGKGEGGGGGQALGMFKSKTEPPALSTALQGIDPML